MPVRIRVQEADFDVGAEIMALSSPSSPMADGAEVGAEVGAVATFVGLVRADKVSSAAATLKQVDGMTLEHYPGMTEKSLASIVAQAQQRWPLLGVRVIHRVGHLRPGERIVFVGVAASHRGDAFSACEFIMDYLKTQAPFWKKEAFAGAQASAWVDARESDEQVMQRWERGT